MDFADALLMVKAGHPELAGWWGKVLGGGGKAWDEMTWDDVIAATKNGKYKDFEIGAMKELNLGSEGIVHMQIVGIDADDLADGSGKATLTFISKELLATSYPMNATKTNTGGWEISAMRVHLKETIKPIIPAPVSMQIKAVKKYSYRYDTQSAALTYDDIWIPSLHEIGAGNLENTGPIYSTVFPDGLARKKEKVGDLTAIQWWLRSAHYNSDQYFYRVTEAGETNGGTSTVNRGIAIGFCL